jgi:hypothetical protein
VAKSGDESVFAELGKRGGIGESGGAEDHAARPSAGAGRC